MTTQASTLFKKHYTLKHITSEYENIIKVTTASGIDKMHKSNFDKIKDEQFNIISRKVISGAYKFTYYKEKLIVKNRNSLPRMISIPTLRDRLVLKILHSILQEVYDVKVPLVQSVVSSVIEEMDNYDSFIKVDITNFFGSINHQILNSKIKSKIRKKEIRNLINDAMKNPTVNSHHRKGMAVAKNDVGVPQGIPIANVLAEIYFKDFDNKYKSKGNLAYFRYVDDILILCSSSEVENIKNEIREEIVGKYKLEVNENKTIDGLLVDGFNFLGYQLIKDLNLNKIVCNVKKEAVLKFEKSLVGIFTRYRNSYGKMSPKEFAFYLNLKITGSIVKNENEEDKNKKFGWLFFYSQINNLNLLYHLDFLIKKYIDIYEMEEALKDIEIKSFAKAFYEITQRRLKSKYIFKPDNLSIKDKKELLNDVFGIPLKNLQTDEHVEKYYNIKVNKKIKELEMDIQDIS